MTQFRIGFACDRCGKHWASERHNEVGDEDVCDECFEDEDEDDNHMTRARKNASSGSSGEYDGWGRPFRRTRDREAKAEHFHREGKMLEAQRQREALAWGQQHGTNHPDTGGCTDSRCARNDT